jgi:hypothetical protein
MASAAKDAKDATDAEKASLDGTNDASIKLRDSMRQVEQSHRDSADAIIQNTGDLQAAQAEWQKGRDAVVKMRIAKGEDADAANAWADQNLGSASEVKAQLEQVYRAWLDLPENRETKYKVEKAEADAALEALKQKLAGIPSVKKITLETYQVGSHTVSAPNFRGGMYAQGVKHFATGGFPSGIYAGVQGGIRDRDRVFAEADMGVPWETYISGRSADRDRNLGIWVQTGRMLGAFGQAAGSGQSAQAPVEMRVVVEPKGGIDILQYVDVRIEQSQAEAVSALRG